MVEADIATTQLTFMNRAAEILLGYTQADIADGVQGPRILAPEYRDFVLNTIAAHLRDRIDPEFGYTRSDSEEMHEIEMLRKDGSRFHSEVMGSYVLDDAGIPVRARFMFRDISERRRIHQALAESEARYRDLVENAGDFMCTVDEKGRITSVNVRGERLTGYSREELLDKSLRELIVPSSAPRGAELRRIKESGESDVTSYEAEIKTKSGRIVPIEVSTRLIGPPGGPYRGFHAVGRDISLRRREAKLLAGQGEVLEMIALARPLADTLTALCNLVESLADRTVCSLLSLHPSTRTLHHLAGASLPTEYIDLIEGTAIGASAGSCGAAAERKAPVVAADIANDPLWADWRQAALRHGLRACWSTPILSATGEVLATFAIYYLDARQPDAAHAGLVDVATALAKLAIEREAAADALQQAEINFRRLFHDNPHATWVFDHETGELVEVNEAAVAQYGYSREEMLDLQSEDFDDLEPSEEVLPAIFLQADHRPHRRRDGTRIWVRIRSHEIDFNGRHAQIVVAEDITRERDALSARLLAETRLRTVAANAPLVLFAVDGHGLVTLLEGRMLGALGLPADSVGRPASNLFAESPAVVGAIDHALAGNEFVETVDIAGRVFEVRCSPIAAGKPGKGVIGLALDVTDRRNAEAALLEAQKRESLGVLAGGIAHDFNNLLTTILGNLYLVAGELAPDSPSRQSLDDAATAARRGADLVARLLDYARPAVDRVARVSLNGLIAETVGLVRPVLGPTIRVEVEGAAGQDTIVGNYGALQQVIINLLVNARDAMPSGGLISIRRRIMVVGPRRARWLARLPAGRYHVIEVADTGSGVPAESASRIFDPFFTTKEVGKGTGLGLPTALAAAQAHGGWLALTPGSSGGAAFQLLLPVPPRAAR